VLKSLVEEYHPRWGARTSNPVKSVKDRLGGFNSCLFRTSRSIKIPFRNSLEPSQ